MTCLKRWNVAVIAAALVTLGAAISSVDAAPAPGNSTNDLSRVVGFEIGGSNLRGQDDITITDVRGTSGTMAAGNLYEIKGNYKLGSEKHATLSAFITTNGQNEPTPIQKTQTMLVDQGSGRFTLYLYMWQDGNPHVSFYSTDSGNSVGGVYFGTGESVLKKTTWAGEKGAAK